jgi:glycosyltransferase involved in cell wall biosynthesis
MLRAKVFCLPSFAEGMALAPLEAATLGCKLLVSRACGYETLPQGTIFHAYDQNQENALEGTMKQMLTQPDSFFEPDLETIRQMQTSYEWETIINHYFRLYESCHQ